MPVTPSCMAGRMVFRLNLFICLLAVILFWPASGNATGQQIRPVYRVAIDREYPPFEFVDAQGDARGFTPSLLRAIGEDAGVKFEFIPMNWSDAVDSLNAGKVDIINMIVTPERAAQFRFSAPHSRISQAIFRNHRNKSIVDLATLAGQRVEFQKNDISLDKLADRTDFIRYIVDSRVEGLLRLNLGKTDAFLCAQQACVRTISEYGFRNIDLVAGNIFTQDFAFATRQDNPSLIELLNRHLARMRASGQLQALDAQWLQGQVVQSNWLYHWLYQHRVGIILLLGLLLASIILFWNISLRKLVNVRTKSLHESESLWKFAIEGSGDGVWDWNILTDEVKYSRRWKEMLGYSDGDILPANDEWLKRIHPDDSLYVAETMQAYLEGKSEIYVVEYRLRCKDDSYKWILGRGMVVSRGDDGKPVRMIGTHTDITERKQAEMQLQLTQFAMEHASFGVFWMDASARIQYVNQQACQTLGYSKEELLKLSIPDIDPLFPAGQWDAHWESMKCDKSQFFETQHRCKDGTIIPVEISANYVKLGEQEYHVAYSRDISNRKKTEEAIRQLAFYDTLTKLPNRRLMGERLIQTMSASRRNGCYGAVMFLDLDNFKPLNDTCGHAVGDLLLIEAAARLKCCVREMDTVARFGGDEFVVMLNELTADKIESVAQARIVAEKILVTLSEPYSLTFYPDGKAETTIEHRCTVSIGVVVFIDHKGSPDDILKWADAAMYQAKEAGRNAIRFYDAQF